MSETIVTKNGFILYTPDLGVINKAVDYGQTILDKDNSVNNKTFCNKNKFSSFVAEYCFGMIFPHFKFVSDYDCDYMYRDIKLDIKSKHRGVYPKLDYSATVPSYQINKQKCNYYVFCSTIGDLKNIKIYYCGGISKEQFIKKARFIKAGQIDGSNKLKFTTNSYKIKYKDLEKFSCLHL